MILAMFLLALGIFLSAFFSGAETGLYRVTRVRLVIDALGGDRIARALLWLTNHPSMFVATVLVGNNVANYLVSLSIVLGVSNIMQRNIWVELGAVILLSPILFVLGESTPKGVFYDAPNRMLRKSGPALLGATILFLPVTSLLWIVSRLLQVVVGQSPQRVQMALARRELEQVLLEGHEVGILNPSQQALAQGLFALANRSVREFVIPAARMTCATANMNRKDALRLARRHRLALLPLQQSTGKRALIGYLRVVDLYLSDEEQLPQPHPVIHIDADKTVLQAHAALQSAGQSLAQVVDTDGKTIGYVTGRHLSKALFRDR